jgi:hypothetical protein
MNPIFATPPYVDPPRVSEGNYALKWFTVFRDHDVADYQSMIVPTGATVSVSGLAHSWFSQKDDPHLSQYTKDGEVLTIADGKPGMDLMLGIDPFGGVDPLAESVVWQVENFYSKPKKIELEVVAQRPVVTIFIRSKTLYPFKHCDVYWDNLKTVITPPEVPPDPDPPVCPKPRFDYTRRVLVLPQGITQAQVVQACEWAYEHDRMGVLYSVDDAMYGPGLTDVTALLGWFDDVSWDYQKIVAFRDRWYPTTKIGEVRFYEVTEPPVPPEPPGPVIPPETPTEPWVPFWWIPYGTAGGFHTDQDRGQSDLARLCLQGGALYPTAKFVVDVGSSVLMNTISPKTRQVLRLIDVPGSGKVEGFDHNYNPEWQADVRMAALMPYMQRYKFTGTQLWWEIINEQSPNTTEGWTALAHFFLRAMDIADANNVHLACFSTSTGEPEIAATLPDGSVEPDMWAAVAATGLFERMVRTPDGIPHAIAGHAYERAGDTWQLFRHRYLYETHIIPRMKAIGQIVIPPYFMTEYALPDDFMHLGGDYLWSNWVSFDREFRKDFYVAGFHTYINGFDEDYDDEYFAIYDRYVQYVIAQKDVCNA